MSVYSLYRVRMWRKPKKSTDIHISDRVIDVVDVTPASALRKAEKFLKPGHQLLDVTWQCTVDSR